MWEAIKPFEHAVWMQKAPPSRWFPSIPWSCGKWSVMWWRNPRDFRWIAFHRWWISKPKCNGLRVVWDLKAQSRQLRGLKLRERRKMDWHVERKVEFRKQFVIEKLYGMSSSKFSQISAARGETALTPTSYSGVPSSLSVCPSINCKSPQRAFHVCLWPGLSPARHGCSSPLLLGLFGAICCPGQGKKPHLHPLWSMSTRPVPVSVPVESPLLTFFPSFSFYLFWFIPKLYWGIIDK